MILVTTSRRPSERIRTLCNDLVNSIPNMKKINRGKKNQFEVAETASGYDINRVIILSRWKQHTGRIELYNVGFNGLISVYSAINVLKFRPRRDFKDRLRSVENLTITNSSSDPRIGYISEMISTFLDVQISSIGDAESFDASMDFSSETVSDKESIAIRFFCQPSGREIGPYISIAHS